MMVDKDIKSLITPSVRTIKATFDEIGVSTQHIKTDIDSINDTLQVISDTLNIFSGSTNLGAQFGMAGPVGWTIPATIKLATNVVSKYVTKRTGISFISWVDFVNSTLVKLGEFVEQLDKVAALTSKYDESAEAATEIDIRQVNLDEELLQGTQSKTKIWKPILGQIAKLSEVIDAIIVAQEESTKETGLLPEDNDISSDIKKMFSVVTGDKARGWQEQVVKLMFSPVYELKDRTQELGNQTRRLTNSISILENLLELEIAQIQAYSGKIPSHEIEILGARIAATITVPQLKDKLIKLNQAIVHYKSILERLDKERKKSRISDKIYKTLQAEYHANLEETFSLLKEVEMQANIWKTTGIPLVEEGINWMQEELEIIRVRKLVGQLTLEELKQRSKEINREIIQLEKAKQILTSL
jgi:hypothetical protein